MEKVIKKFLSVQENIYGKTPLTKLREVDLWRITGCSPKDRKRAVVLIDEYDKPLLDVLDTDISATVDGERRLLEEHHRNMLKGFYSVFNVLPKK